MVDFWRVESISHIGVFLFEDYHLLTSPEPLQATECDSLFPESESLGDVMVVTMSGAGAGDYPEEICR